MIVNFNEKMNNWFCKIEKRLISLELLIHILFLIKLKTEGLSKTFYKKIMDQNRYYITQKLKFAKKNLPISCVPEPTFFNNYPFEVKANTLRSIILTQMPLSRRVTALKY